MQASTQYPASVYRESVAGRTGVEKYVYMKGGREVRGSLSSLLPFFLPFFLPSIPVSYITQRNVTSSIDKTNQATTSPSRRRKLRRSLLLKLRQLRKLRLQLADNIRHGTCLFEEGGLPKGTHHVSKSQGSSARLGQSQ